ncbi:MAG: acyltransferase [Croceibacterium sp.]
MNGDSVTCEGARVNAPSAAEVESAHDSRPDRHHLETERKSKELSPRIYLPALTSVRFFAAYAVICHHFLGQVLSGIGSQLLSSLGDASVSLFFILSGFVITISNREIDGFLRKSKKDYLVSRFARILPQYIFAFFLAAPFFLLSTMAKHPPLTSWLPRVLLNGAAYLSMLQAWVPKLANAWNGPAWSLSVEMFFYVMFLVLPLPQKGNLLRWLLLGLSLSIAPIVASQIPPLSASTFQAFWYFWPPMRLGEFMLGILMAQAFRIQLFSDAWRAHSGLAALAVFGCCLIGLAVLGPIGARIATSVLLPPGLLLVAISGNRAASLLRSRAMIALGDASYGLYLIHVPLMPIYFWASGRKPFGHLAGVGDFLIYSVVAVGLSLAVNRWLEQPAARAIKAKFGPGRRLFRSGWEKAS